MHETLIARKQSPLGKIPATFYLANSTTIKDNHNKSVRGLFTSRFIHKGQLIGEYRGPLISVAHSQRKSRFTQYFFAVVDSESKNSLKFVIDGANSRRSSFLRYVNAPNRARDGNTRFVQVEDSILLYATKNIHAQTELLAWYGTHTKQIINQR